MSMEKPNFLFRVVTIELKYQKAETPMTNRMNKKTFKTIRLAASFLAAIGLVLAVAGQSNLSALSKKRTKGMKTPGGTVTGTLSDRGVECPAMIGDDGRLYTLTGVDRKKLVVGARVRITGEAKPFSKCMQGQTIQVKSITFLK